MRYGMRILRLVILIHLCALMVKGGLAITIGNGRSRHLDLSLFF